MRVGLCSHSFARLYKVRNVITYVGLLCFGGKVAECRNEADVSFL